MKKILILSNSNLDSDPRILKQIIALKEDYLITTSGYTKSDIVGVYKEYPLFNRIDENLSSFWLKVLFLIRLMIKNYSKVYWNKTNKNAFQILRKDDFNAIIANELNTLPIANKIAQEQDIPIYCDLHEYYFGKKGKWWMSILTRTYNKWLFLNHNKHIKKISTVSQGIVDLYKSEFDIDCDLINNACKYFDLKPKKVDPNNIKLVSHGAAIRDRKLEIMIDAMKYVDDRFTLDMYLMPTDKKYIEELKIRAKEISAQRIRLYSSIPFAQIQMVLNRYDIGVYLLFPSSINNKLALPNKLFEFIQARLCVAIGPSPEMVRILRNYDVGIVADDFTAFSIASAINALNVDQIIRHKNNAHKCAKILNSETNMNSLYYILDKLTFER